MSHGGKSKHGSLRHQNIMWEKKENSDPMGMGLETNNITPSEIQKWIPSTAKPHVEHKKIAIVWVWG